MQVKSPRLDIDRLVISGGGARMKGLKEYLEKKLGKPVELLDTAEGFDLRRLDGEAARLFDEAGGEMAVAVGLAVADAEPDAWKFELLPEEYVARKRFWSKTFWAYAAAVMLVASLAAGYVRALRDVAAAEIAGEAVQTRLVEVRGRSGQYEEAAKRNDDLRAEVELLRAQTRYGLTAIEFLRHLRAVTEEGINIEKLFEPTEPDEEALAAGQIVLIVEGRLDKTRIKEPFRALDGYMGALKVSDFVADASITTQAEERGPGAKPGDEDRMRFSFKVKLAPSAIKSANAGGSGESGRAAEGIAP